MDFTSVRLFSLVEHPAGYLIASASTEMTIYVDHHNNTRLNSGTGYITPKNMLVGRQ